MSQPAVPPACRHATTRGGLCGSGCQVSKVHAELRRHTGFFQQFTDRRLTRRVVPFSGALHELAARLRMAPARTAHREFSVPNADLVTLSRLTTGRALAGCIAPRSLAAQHSLRTSSR